MNKEGDDPRLPSIVSSYALFLPGLFFASNSVGRCNLFDETDECAAEITARQLIERLGHTQRVMALQETEQGGFGEPGLVRLRGSAGAVKERYRYLKDVADLPKSARADAVRPFFVFLNLLEGDPELFPELGLRKAAFEAAGPDTAAHLCVPVIHPRGRFWLSGHRDLAPIPGRLEPGG